MWGLGGLKPSYMGALNRPMVSAGSLRRDDGSLADAEDRELVAALREGREAAFERLVRVHGRWMLALATRLLGSDKEASDVVQDSFLSAFCSLPRFRGEARLSTWLRRIVVNRALMKLRAHKRKPEQSLEALLPNFLPDGHQAWPSPSWAERADVLIARQETRELVRRLIDELPEAYRTVLLLRDIEELHTQEVADLLKVTPNCVKIRLHRARQALKTLLDPYFQSSPPGDSLTSSSDPNA